MPVTLKPVFGSTVDEFIENAGSEFGQGMLGKTSAELKWKCVFAQKKVTKATLSLKITSATAHWAGPGIRNGKPAPQPDSANRQAIARVEALNKSHEENHIKSYQSVFNKKKSEIEKKMIGQTEADFPDIYAPLEGALKEACETLHETEGLVSKTVQGGQIVIEVKAAGPGSCD
jgi:hypothetical protein